MSLVAAPVTVDEQHLDEQHLDDLRALTTGTLHTRADPTWDQVRTPWVVNVEQTPLAVLEVASADDVVAAVRWAAARGRQVSAQPSGHGATGRMDQVLLLRTRALDEVTVDRGRRTAWVGAGVKARELLEALEGTGLTFLAGSNPDPSVVGMTITGGISWFGRRYGVGADSIRSVELVDGTGQLRTVSAAEDPELFWALRGGGGDFGIITRVELDLHPAPELYGGRLLWPATQTREVLRAFAEVTRTAPRELTVWFHAYQFPPFEEVPEPIRGKAFASVAVAHLGSAEEAEELLAPFRALPGPAMDLMGDVPLSALGSIADEPTDPTPALEHSWLLDRVDDELVERVAAVLDAGTPLAAIQIRHLGGAFTDVRPDQGSHGPVPEPYSLFALGIPAVPELVDPIVATFDRLGEAVEEHTSGRTLLNFLGSHGDPARWWSEATRDRLVLAKAASDPALVIRSNRPVSG